MGGGEQKKERQRIDRWGLGARDGSMAKANEREWGGGVGREENN